MTRRIVATLLRKDFTLYFRNRFFAFVTILGLVFYAAIYYVMPSSVDEVLKLGFYAPVMPPILEQAQDEGLAIERFDSADALKEAVIEGDYQAGLALPDDIMESQAAGEQATVELYFPADAPPEFKDAIVTLIREMVFLQLGQGLNLEVDERILGVDMVGGQIAPRDRMLPLFAVLLILVEMLGLASLLSEEIAGGTLMALLITPMTIAGLFIAKGATGVSLAFGQAAIFLGVTGGLGQQPLLILLALLLGAVMVTGIAFLIASLGKDLMSVMGWSIPILIILIIPAFAVIFPGATTAWIKAIPSYYLVDAVHLAGNFGLGLEHIWQDLVILLALGILFFALGIGALRRKMV
ncbi:MAG: ABC transporter permease [Chloroflexota bacterium]|nr:MAG: ABC transporter permease [Chloroflexota bacterium]